MGVIFKNLSKSTNTEKLFIRYKSRYRHDRAPRVPKNGISCKSSLEYIYINVVQLGKKILGFDEYETGHVYIRIPKRGASAVYDMRSDVYNPNQQICYEQRHGHDTGIMIEVRTPELTYENRFEKHTMKVLSSSESNDILDKMGIKQQENNVDSVDNDDVDGGCGKENDNGKERCVESEEGVDESMEQSLKNRNQVNRRNNRDDVDSNNSGEDDDDFLIHHTGLTGFLMNR